MFDLNYHRRRRRRPLSMPVSTSLPPYFQSRRRPRPNLSFFFFFQRMMINDDHKHTNGLMQQQPSSLSSSSVNHLQSSSFTIYDNNHHLQLPEKTSNSSQIRLALRCLCSFDDKHEQFFDQIFRKNEQTKNISEGIFQQYLTRNSINTIIILAGHYREICQLQQALIFLILTHSIQHNFTLRISLQEFPSKEQSPSKGKYLLFFSDCPLTSPIQSSVYLQNLCFQHQSSPILLTFHLIARSSTAPPTHFHILTSNNSTDEHIRNEFCHMLMSLSLSLPSNRQKQSLHLSPKRNSPVQSIFHQFDEHFLYILATVKNEKQLKSWTQIQRLVNMSRDSSIMARPQEEIWVDGPLSSSNRKKAEIWIDGPREFRSRHRSKPMYTKAKHPFAPYDLDRYSSSNTFDTESVVSSHCHLPVLPVFKDHSLLPFRAANQTLPRSEPTLPPPVNLKLSTDQLNDDLEMLEKTIETLLVPSPIVPSSSIMTKSFNRMEHLSSLMSNDEKNKRLSRIVSPTRFDKLFLTATSTPSVPTTPCIVPKNRLSRPPNCSIPSPKKPKIPIRTTSLAEAPPRPSILQRLFGLRPSTSTVIQSPPSSPLISPLTVTLDSHDDLMPLTTSSTASSASGRASSSGYESMSNTTVLDEMMASMSTNGNDSIRLRKNDRRWNSPMINSKFPHQQRLSQLKYRQNELNLELAMTKSCLQIEHPDVLIATINPSPMHSIASNQYTHDEEQERCELEKDIEHLERRLALAKSQLTFVKKKPCKA